MHPRHSLPALLLAGLVVGCNDSHPPASESVVKMGFDESELYDPTHHPAGTLLPEGATAMISLESVNGPAHDGDTGGIGYDELWFEWPRPTVLGMFMEDEDLGVIARVELRDVHGGVLLDVDDARRYGEVHLPVGIYGLRLHAAHDEPTPMHAFIRYELAAPLANGQQFGIQSDESEVEMGMTWNGCPKCDLRGMRFYERQFPHHFNLAGANLTNAYMREVRMPDVDLSGADLSEAHIVYSYLGGANLTGAILWQTRFVWTDLTGADLTGAILSFNPEIVCGPGSIGICQHEGWEAQEFNAARR
ncbi:MAG: pentapeptide repeat-containing protein [Chromatiales bacterium]|nr:pentapeptide repeat-containing protein [Chromatiales bacterium]